MHKCSMRRGFGILVRKPTDRLSARCAPFFAAFLTKQRGTSRAGGCCWDAMDRAEKSVKLREVFGLVRRNEDSRRPACSMKQSTVYRLLLVLTALVSAAPLSSAGPVYEPLMGLRPTVPYPGDSLFRHSDGSFYGTKDAVLYRVTPAGELLTFPRIFDLESVEARNLVEAADGSLLGDSEAGRRRQRTERVPLRSGARKSENRCSASDGVSGQRLDQRRSWIPLGQDETRRCCRSRHDLQDRGSNGCSYDYAFLHKGPGATARGTRSSVSSWSRSLGNQS